MWTGTTSRGYGQIWHEERMQLAHRVAYMLLVGEIPEGMTIDHVRARGCTSTNCVNPEHLEPVTTRENNHRGDTVSGVNVRKTKCDHGHLLSGGNVRVWVDRRGHEHRICRTCTRERQRKYRRSRVA